MALASAQSQASMTRIRSPSISYWTESITATSCSTDVATMYPHSPLSPTSSRTTADTRDSARSSVSRFSTVTDDTEITLPDPTYERSTPIHAYGRWHQESGFVAPWASTSNVQELDIPTYQLRDSVMAPHSPNNALGRPKSEKAGKGFLSKFGHRRRPEKLNLSKEAMEMHDLGAGRARTATAATAVSPTSTSWAQLDIYAAQAQVRHPVYATAPHSASADASFFRAPKAMPSMSRLYQKQPQTAGAVKLRVKQPGQSASADGSTSTAPRSEADGQSVYTTITTSSAASSSTRSTIPVYGRGGAARALPKEPKPLQVRKFGSQESLMSECRAPEPDLTPGKTGGKAFVEGLFKSKAAKQAEAKGKGKVTVTIVEEGQAIKSGWRPPHVGHDTVSMKARASSDTLQTFTTFSSSKSKERVYTYGRGGAGRMVQASEFQFHRRA